MINLAPNKQIKIHRKFNQKLYFSLLDLKKKEDPPKLILQSLQRDKNSYNILPIIRIFHESFEFWKIGRASKAYYHGLKTYFPSD